MSTVVASVVDTVRNSPPEVKAAVLSALLQDSLVLRRGSFPLKDDSGRVLGHFIRAAEKPPVLSPEDLAELDRRLLTIDNALTPEEFIEAVIKKVEAEDSSR